MQKYGGISTYFRELFNGLIKYKHKSNLIIYEKNSEFLSGYDNVILNKKRIFERYRSIKNLPPNSIIHSSYYRSSNHTNIITLYDFTYERFGKGYKKSIHVIQKRNAIVNSDAILCISENTKSDLLKYYPEAINKKIFVTHLAASNNYFNKKIDYKLRILDPYVLFVGARSTYKNFNQLVKAMKYLSGIKLYIVGGGDFTKEENILLQKYCGNRYKHFKDLNNDKLNDLYNSAICLVYPSLYEGFGIPVIEAMSAGCPVIASNSSSITEIANSSAILLNEPNHFYINEAINKILIEENFNLYRSLGTKNALNFSWDKTVSETINWSQKI